MLRESPSPTARSGHRPLLPGLQGRREGRHRRSQRLGQDHLPRPRLRRIDARLGLGRTAGEYPFRLFRPDAAAIDPTLSLLELHPGKGRADRDGRRHRPEPRAAARALPLPRAPPRTCRSPVSPAASSAALQLVRLLADSPNFLLLDEPTNDLDIERHRAPRGLPLRLPGCVLAVSHDRAFLDGLADSLIVLDGSGAGREYVGRYADYRGLAGEIEAVAPERRPQDLSGRRRRRARCPPPARGPPPRDPRVARPREEGPHLRREPGAGRPLRRDLVPGRREVRLRATLLVRLSRRREMARSRRRYASSSPSSRSELLGWEALASREQPGSRENTHPRWPKATRYPRFQEPLNETLQKNLHLSVSHPGRHPARLRPAPDGSSGHSCRPPSTRIVPDCRHGLSGRVMLVMESEASQRGGQSRGREKADGAGGRSRQRAEPRRKPRARPGRGRVDVRWLRQEDCR